MEGKITITPDGGKPATLTAGNALAVEKGFREAWEIEVKVRKHFAIQLKQVRS